MNEYFDIADRTSLFNLDKEIYILENELESKKNELSELKKTTFDTFCGKKILENKVTFTRYEGGITVPHYSIIIVLNGRKIEAYVHSSNGKYFGKKFLASCTRWDGKHYIELEGNEITQYYKDNSNNEFESFNEAKTRSLEML